MKILPAICLCLLTLPILATANSLEQASDMCCELTKVRYSFVNHSMLESNSSKDPILAAADADEGSATVTDAFDYDRKSPVKAFLLSLAVPGLGQYYYGSRAKPLMFLGIEAVSWFLHINWHGDGDNLTDDYESFNNTHWSESRYRTSLDWIYGSTQESEITEKEINHTLPETKVQQYYEMTGKYNQFAWGWDDADLEGNAFEDYSAGNPPPRIRGDSVPYSANRVVYEGMRDDANNKYDDATKMIYVAMANHLISAFEAFFMTRHLNAEAAKAKADFANIKIRARLRSIYESMDTPYLAFTYKF
ncbi:hypothetical protein GF356_04700 [candidate division GN15 bacterium]|nr:hypothetical protein [candidate division GN15 bacterium]